MLNALIHSNRATPYRASGFVHRPTLAVQQEFLNGSYNTVSSPYIRVKELAPQAK